MFYCFVPPEDVSDESIRITGSNERHLRAVLRAQPGDPVRIRSDRFIYETHIEQIGHNEITVRIVNRKETVAPTGPAVVLATALIQEKRFDLLLQTACQMGVSSIQPLLTDHTADHRVKSGKPDRWAKIVEESCMQSQNPYPPAVLPVMSFRDTVLKEKSSGDQTLLLIPSELEEQRKMDSTMFQNRSRIVLFIGPEGGWSPDETLFAKEQGMTLVTLGERILRTETAAAVSLTLILERTGRL